MALFPFVMNSQDYFTDGMTWRMHVTGTTSPTPTSSIELVTIEKMPDADCFNMYYSREDNLSDRKLVAVIKSEDGKVYFKPSDVMDSEWYLAYDFTLNPGDGCYIYSMLQTSIDTLPYKSYIKCVGRQENWENRQFDLLQVEEHTDHNCSFVIGSGAWLAGVSSMNGILYNNRFGDDGRSSTLISVENSNNQILYSNPQAQTSDISDIADDFIKVKDLDLYITVKNTTSGTIYTQDGILLGNYNFTGTTTQIKLPCKGVYILKLGNRSIKIFA